MKPFFAAFAAFSKQLLAFCVALSLAVPAEAARTDPKSVGKSPKPAPGSRLEGVITGPNQKPIRGAAVTVRMLDGDATWQSLPSDSRGRFQIQGLPYGWADLAVTTESGVFLGDQAINLPPGTKVVINFALLTTADKPASWWKERKVERPAGMSEDQVAGMAQSSQRLTGIEYWKSPGGIAILVSVTVVALGVIAAGGGKYRPPASP